MIKSSNSSGGCVQKADYNFAQLLHVHSHFLIRLLFAYFSFIVRTNSMMGLTNPILHYQTYVLWLAMAIGQLV